jgi:hypothetical protein
MLVGTAIGLVEGATTGTVEGDDTDGDPVCRVGTDDNGAAAGKLPEPEPDEGAGLVDGDDTIVAGVTVGFGPFG